MSELIGRRPDGIYFFNPGEDVVVDRSTSDPSFESRKIEIGEFGSASLLGMNWWEDVGKSEPRKGLIIDRDSLNIVENVYDLKTTDELYEISIKLEDSPIITSRSSAVGKRANVMAMSCVMQIDGPSNYALFAAEGDDMEDFTWFYKWDLMDAYTPVILAHPDSVVLTGMRFQFNGRMHLPHLIRSEE